MRLVDAPADAAAVAGTFKELRLAAEALLQSETAIIVKLESRRGEGVGHWTAPTGALNPRVVRVALDCV